MVDSGGEETPPPPAVVNLFLRVTKSLDALSDWLANLEAQALASVPILNPAERPLGTNFEVGQGLGNNHQEEPQEGQDGIGRIKVKIPSFEGKVDADACIDWETKIEKIWDCHNFT